MSDQTCDRCGKVPDQDYACSFEARYLCGECAQRAMDVLDMVAQWWADGGASLSPDAMLGDNDLPIRELVESATGIRRE